VGDRLDAYRVLMGKPEGKRPLERPRRILEDNMKWVFKKWDRGSMDWIQLARDRDSWRALMNAAINLRGP
jgi:hypothetical protein